MKNINYLKKNISYTKISEIMSTDNRDIIT